MADIRLAKPAAGTTQTVPSAPNGRFIFDFPADAATLTRNGDDLVLTFEDGSSIQLQGFYTTYSKEEMPSFQVEGVEISGQDFFAALGEDLMPAAGPAANSASRSGRYNEYGGSDLLDGIDHLGRLDIGFDGGTQLATDTVEPSAPEVDIDYDVTIAAGPEAGAVDLTVYEGGLAGASQAGQAATPTTASGSLNINAPDGVASIVIGDVVVYENGKLTGNVVTTDEGTLAVTGYDPVTGKLDFSYTLDRNTTEHDKSDPATDTQISHDLTVTVTDTDGDSDSTTITVNVVDDVPTAHADSFTLTEAQAQAGGSGANVLNNDVFGADAPADKTVTSIEGGTLGQPVSGKHGTLTLNENGTYTYQLNEGVDVPKGETYTENFTYTITDKDGDTSEATLTITIKGDENVPVVTVDTPEPGDANIMVDEGKQPEHGGEGHAQSGSGSFTVQLNGEDGVITVGGESGWKVTVTGDSANVTGSVVTVNGVEVTVTGATQAADGTWTVNYGYELTGPQKHGADNSPTDETLKGEIAISVTDATGDTAEGKLTVEVHDDGPTITASDMSTTVVPGSGAGNLADGEAADFTKGTGGQSLGHSTNLSGWEGVTMTAAKVYYNGFGDNVQISDIDDNGSYTLKYSPYKGSDNDKADWGLTVDAGEHNEEISVIDGTASEAVIFDLGGQLAYGVTIDFGAFYSGDGTAGTTAWDHVSEKALVTFYRDGQIVGSTVVEGNSPDGKFTLNSSDVVLGGFDKVVISAVDNSTTQFPNENSDFTIQGIDFITKRDDPIIINEGKVTAESGADGFADAYADSHAKFDLAGMVDKNGGTLNEDGTSGTIMVLMDGSKQKVTLELSEGLSGESILTGTLADGEQLFTATLDKDGNWTMEQYDQFRVPGEEGQSSNQFELVFKTEDADGDIAGATVKVPLEVVDQTPATDTSIDNGNDTITITGGEGIAGTVAAGDSGGVEVQTTVQPGQDYNISIMLDLSGSMNDPSGSAGMSRLDMAKEALTTFINDTLAKHDGEINLQLITFNKTATEEDTWVLKSGTTEEIKNYNQAEIAKIVKTLDQIGKGVEGTNYEAAMEKATEWFSKDTAEDGVAGNGGENLAFFISDGQPTYYYGTDWWGNPKVEGEGNYSNQETVRQTLEAAQDLQNAGSGVQVNAIGIGTSKSLHEKAQTILDLIDNTGGSEQTQTEYPCQHQVQVGTGWLGTPKYEWQWTTGEWEESKPLILGDSDLVDSKDGLTAALVGGGTITSTELADAGGDKVDASDSTSSAIIYGDVMNTDRLLYELKQLELSNLVMAGAVVSALPGYGSGSEVFQWLEGNGDRLTGDYAGWTHDDTLKYMLEHAEELGYETRVDGNGEFYLVTADGTVLNMDGTEANVGLDSLTGRGGGNDTIIGSQADDVIYGQEGNDLLVGDAPSESGEGSTVGSIEGTTVASIKAMDTDGLDAFIQSVEGTDADGDDRLFGGTGDDVLLGMGGDDYIDGGAGEDAIFGGSGNDIIVYDSNDYLVSGGSGIDFMVSDNSTLTLTELLSGGKDGKDGPIVDSIEVLLKGDAALSLTSIQELADKYGITLGTNDAGQETLTLDMSKWTAQQDGSYDFKGDADLTLETNLQQDSGASSDSDGEMAQQVFILQNSNS